MKTTLTFRGADELRVGDKLRMQFRETRKWKRALYALIGKTPPMRERVVMVIEEGEVSVTVIPLCEIWKLFKS